MCKYRRNSCARISAAADAAARHPAPLLKCWPRYTVHSNKPLVFILPQWIFLAIFSSFFNFEYIRVQFSVVVVRPRQSPNCLFMCRCSDPRFFRLLNVVLLLNNVLFYCNCGLWDTFNFSVINYVGLYSFHDKTMTVYGFDLSTYYFDNVILYNQTRAHTGLMDRNGTLTWKILLLKILIYVPKCPNVHILVNYYQMKLDWFQ